MQAMVEKKMPSKQQNIKKQRTTQDGSERSYLIQSAAVLVDGELNTVTDWWNDVVTNHNLFSCIVKPARQTLAAFTINGTMS